MSNQPPHSSTTSSGTETHTLNHSRTSFENAGPALAVKTGPENASAPEASFAVDPSPAGEELAKAEGAKGGVGEGRIGAPGAGPGAPEGGKMKMDKYAYGFFAPQMKPFRGIAKKILFGGVMILIILMWLCVPVYYGSLWNTNVYTNHLTVRVIDRDGGAIGQAISSALLDPSLRPALGFESTPSSDFPTAQDVINDIIEEGAWATIVISSGATANLQSARQNGLNTYNGSSAVQVYYAQARSENAENAYLIPYIQSALGAITGRLSAQSVAQYISANAGNTTAIQLLAQAPSTMSSPIYFTMNNLRPYNQPIATAITLVGLIYMLIFSFIVTMMNLGVREIISPFLTTRSYIAYRIILPLVVYIPVSFLFAMTSLPFGVHFDAHFTYAGGFFLFWFAFYLGMASVGLATEFAVTILGPKFTGFFLIPIIIANVSVCSFPHDIQPWIYRYGVGMPFYNVSRVVRTIIFDTKNDIGMNLGILIAWIVLSIITISIATWLSRRKAVNAHRAAKDESHHHFGEKA